MRTNTSGKYEVIEVKKVILGTGLVICGVLGILAYIIKEAIYFASPNSIIQSGNDPFIYAAIVVLLVGAVLNVIGFRDKDK